MVEEFIFVKILKMRLNLLIVLGITIFSLMSCGGDDDECTLMLNIPSNFNQTVFMDNISTIESYLTDNGLTAQKTSSGLYYIFDTPGDSIKPTLCNNVTVNYRGYLPNGNVFDASSIEGVTFPLTNVILGWGEGIQLFGEGGEGVLLIPSYLGYGTNPPPGSGIPQNSVLIFDVALLNF